MELINDNNPALRSDVELVKQQISIFVERGYMGKYGKGLPYTTEDGKAMFEKFKAAGVKCTMRPASKPGEVNIYFSELSKLPKWPRKEKKILK